jgi:hypothetical protein
MLCIGCAEREALEGSNYCESCQSPGGPIYKSHEAFDLDELTEHAFAEEPDSEEEGESFD